MTEKPHAPYLMPSGQHWSYVLKHERDATSVKQKKKSSRAKDDLWFQLQRNKVSAGSEQELQEIRAIEQAGHRRRRRWLNEKVLRDMAGPMSASDMQAQFSPVPFGSYPPPSAFAVAMSAEHLPVWEHFRNIDLDKEAKVLQRWEQHNRKQQQQQQHRSGPVSGDHPSQQDASSSAALNKWRAVSRGARCALKQANVHSVLQLEMQLIQGLEQCGEVLLDLPDGFARLLVHGLAEFHGCTSATRLVNGQKQVLVQRKHSAQQQQQQQEEQPQQQGAPGSQCEVPCRDVNNAAAAAATCGKIAAASTAVIDSLAGISGRSSSSSAKVEGTAKQQQDVGGVEWLLHRDDITCSDVVMALHELGSSFNQHALERYMLTHVHGGSSIDCRSVEDRAADMQC